jgi:hypothetical protein
MALVAPLGPIRKMKRFFKTVTPYSSTTAYNSLKMSNSTIVIYIKREKGYVKGVSYVLVHWVTALQIGVESMTLIFLHNARFRVDKFKTRISQMRVVTKFRVFRVFRKVQRSYDCHNLTALHHGTSITWANSLRKYPKSDDNWRQADRNGRVFSTVAKQFAQCSLLKCGMLIAWHVKVEVTIAAHERTTALPPKLPVSLIPMNASHLDQTNHSYRPALKGFGNSVRRRFRQHMYRCTQCNSVRNLS